MEGKKKPQIQKQMTRWEKILSISTTGIGHILKPSVYQQEENAMIL